MKIAIKTAEALTHRAKASTQPARVSRFAARLPRLLLAGVFSALVVACGGGGGGGSGGGDAPPIIDRDAALKLAAEEFGVAVVDVSGDRTGGEGGSDAGGVGGSAGDGAPIRLATIIMVDKNGLQRVGKTDANGNYLIATRTTLRAPIVVKIIDAGGKVLTSVLNEDISANVFKRAMINPLTDKIVSDVLTASTPGTDKQLNGSNVDATKLDKAVTDLRTSVQASLAAVSVTNTTSFNAISNRYIYNGQGVDAIIDSIAHTRNPNTGSTELRSKLGSTGNDANGVPITTLVTAATPLAVSQVVALNPGELTFEKLNNFVNEINLCLSNTSIAANCDDDTSAPNQRFFRSADYKNNGKDFDEDFSTLCSDTNRECVPESTFRNPVILFVGKYANSTNTFNDLAVVEFTIRQPRTGPLAGNNPQPIEYTKIVVFRRDDSLTRAKAGNWIAHGNQRFFDWGIQTRYRTTLEQNPVFQATLNGSSSRTLTGIRLNFSAFRFKYEDRLTTRGYTPSNVYAIRVTGPGMPANGVVWTPGTSNSNDFGILNKTGVIPAPGTTVPNGSTDFRLAGAFVSTGQAMPNTLWQGSQTTLPHYADVQTTDFSRLGANAVYRAEFFTNSSPGVPIVELAANFAQVESPVNYVRRPLHDLSPNLALVSPGALTLTGSVTLNWIRNAEAIRIENVGIAVTDSSGVGFFAGRNLPDRAALNPSSTSVAITLATPLPGYTPTPFASREVTLRGTAARAFFQQDFRYTPQP